MSSFDAAPYIKEIGRGKHGAKGLTRAQARDLYAALLADRVCDMQIGGVFVALRVKGESQDELLGFMQAIDEHNLHLTDSARSAFSQLQAQSLRTGKPVVVVPSYNGARRKPNLTPLFAGLLAQNGFPVLVHGLPADPTGRVASAEIFGQIEWSMATPPQFVALPDFSPSLQRLMNARGVLGVRNVTHTLVKCLVPSAFENSLLVTGYTHPEFFNLQCDLFANRLQRALIVRANEGEPVMSPHKLNRMDAIDKGLCRCITEGERGMSQMPDPHPDLSASATANAIMDWLNNPETIPETIQKQVAAVLELAQ